MSPWSELGEKTEFQLCPKSGGAEEKGGLGVIAFCGKLACPINLSSGDGELIGGGLVYGNAEIFQRSQSDSHIALGLKCSSDGKGAVSLEQRQSKQQSGNKLAGLAAVNFVISRFELPGNGAGKGSGVVPLYPFSLEGAVVGGERTGH